MWPRGPGLHQSPDPTPSHLALSLPLESLQPCLQGPLEPSEQLRGCLAQGEVAWPQDSEGLELVGKAGWSLAVAWARVVPGWSRSY